MEISVYILLAGATSLYAYLLDRNRRRWEPDMSWIEVSIGVAIVLGAPALLARIAPADWSVYEGRVLIAFVVGGFPIAVWQTIRNRRDAQETRREAERLLAKERGHVNSSDSLAE